MGSRVPAIAIEQYNFDANPGSTRFPLQDTMNRDGYYYDPGCKMLPGYLFRIARPFQVEA